MNIRSISTITAATLLLVSLGLPCALADDIRATPQVRVIGKSSQHIAPDRMFWTMKVENKGKELEQVADAHLKHAAALLELLKKQGIDEKKLQTQRGPVLSLLVNAVFSSWLSKWGLPSLIPTSPLIRPLHDRRDRSGVPNRRFSSSPGMCRHYLGGSVSEEIATLLL